ncbi:MAG: hypothetical protein DRJ42_06505 [Deltaproteobacteria bacterium]|nr:MAG: hypothetical protein DRJ42_06505 [Deltaproteobacteria bacterium]
MGGAVTIMVGDLATHFTEAPRVVMDFPPLGADSARFDFTVIKDGMRGGAQVVLWPSLSPVRGRWEGVDGLLEIRFVRDAPPGPDWEAVIVDRVAIGAVLPGIDTSEPTTVARYSPSSRPWLMSAESFLIGRGSRIYLNFSERIGTSEVAHGFVRLDQERAGGGCTPFFPVNPLGSPVSALMWDCAPMSDGDRVMVHIDGTLTATAGGTVAFAYGRPAGTEVALDLTLRSESRTRSDGTVVPRTDGTVVADHEVLRMALGVEAVAP